MMLLLRVVKWVWGMRDACFVMKPKLNLKGVWKLVAHSDRKYAGEKYGQNSAKGYIIAAFGFDTCWKYRTQKGFTLSTTETEYITLSEVCTQIIFVCSIIELLRVRIEYPVVIHVDNIGAAFLANNTTAPQRTKQMDASHHFYMTALMKE